MAGRSGLGCGGGRRAKAGGLYRVTLGVISIVIEKSAGWISLWRNQHSLSLSSRVQNQVLGRYAVHSIYYVSDNDYTNSLARNFREPFVAIISASDPMLGFNHVARPHCGDYGTLLEQINT